MQGNEQMQISQKFILVILHLPHTNSWLTNDTMGTFYQSKTSNVFYGNRCIIYYYGLISMNFYTTARTKNKRYHQIFGVCLHLSSIRSSRRDDYRNRQAKYAYGCICWFLMISVQLKSFPSREVIGLILFDLRFDFRLPDR